MAIFRFRSSLALGILLFASFCAHALNAEPRPYELQFAVYREGRLAGNADVKMEQKGENWIIRTGGSATHGLGRLLRVMESEQVEGHYLDGRFRPEHFRHHSRIAGIDHDWSARFDWQQGTVVISKGNEVLSLNMGDGALDKLSLQLELQRRLHEQDPDLQFFRVYDDRIKPRNYRVFAPEPLETSLGCLATLRVELVTADEEHFSRSWHAPDLDFLAVRLERHKPNGVHLEMRITRMILDGTEIEPRLGPCAGQQ